jgi:hypothetical protein
MQKLNKILTLLVLTGLLLITIPANQVLAVSPWLGNWTHRLPYTFNNTLIDGNLTDFPVKIWVSNSSGFSGVDLTPIFTEVGANSTKIAVTTSDATTQCYVEVVSWDTANLTAELYTKVPAVTNTTTLIYLYYDNLQPANSTYIGVTGSTPAKAVWDANFVAVYHMNDGADTSHINDSTANGFTGTKKGAAEPALATGLKGAAQQGDGANDTINYGHNASLDITAALTVESFIRSASNTSNSGILGKNTAFRMGGFAAGSLKYTWNLKDSAGVYNYGTTVSDLPLNQWHSLIGTYLRNDYPKIYLNGALDFTSATTMTNALISYSANDLITNFAANMNYYPGLIDEIRVSNIARSAAYIKLTNYSERDTAGTWGSEQTLIVPNITTSAATVINVTYATMNGNVTNLNNGNVTVRGFVYGLDTGNLTSDWNETGTFNIGVFSQNITGLTALTTYYFKAYATNQAGTGYGTVLNFTTLDVPIPPVIGYPQSGGLPFSRDIIVKLSTQSQFSVSWESKPSATYLVRAERFKNPTSPTDGYFVYTGASNICTSIRETNTRYVVYWLDSSGTWILWANKNVYCDGAY